MTVVLLTLASSWSPASALAAHPTRIIRASGTGLEPADAASFYGSVSSQARYVAFQSRARLAGSDGSETNIFVRDMRSAYTWRVTVGRGDGQPDGASASPSISADGSLVAFASGASNLVASDTNSSYDVFVWNRETGAVRAISRSGAGVLGNGDSFAPSISADGRTVAFASSASNLVAGDTAGYDDIFVCDLSTGAIRRISVGYKGAQANGHSTAPSISADGSKVAFQSAASNLVAGDTNKAVDVFVVDVATGKVTRASVSSAGKQADLGSSAPAIAGNGASVAFESLATNLVARDTNKVRDVFVRDLARGTTVRVSVSSRGLQARSESREPAISSDGRRVLYSSAAAELVVGDTNRMADVFMRDLRSRTTTRVSAVRGLQGNGSSAGVGLSPDGLRAVFHSESSNWVAGDSNASSDVFVAAFGPRVYDRVAGTSVYSDAVQASRRSCPGGADAAVLVLASDQRSALAASGLAGAVGGPLLYTFAGRIPRVTHDELVRLDPERVYVVGAEGAIGKPVLSSLRGIVGRRGIVRVSGRGAAATAAAITEATVAAAGARFDGTVLLANPDRMAESIGGVPLAASAGRPVVLVGPRGRVHLPHGTRRVLLVGGQDAIPAVTESGLVRRFGPGRVVRLSGSDASAGIAAASRWGVARARLSWDGVTVVNPSDPAAIAGAVMAGRMGTVVLSATGTSLPGVSRAELARNALRIDTVHVVGGTSAIPAGVYSAIRSALGG